MMAEDTSGDIENPTPSATACGSKSKDDPNKKWKVIALSTFLLTAVVLTIVLGVTLGNDGGGSDSSPNTSTGKKCAGERFSEGDFIENVGWECVNSTSYDGTASTCGPDGQIIETKMEFTCAESAPYCVQCGPRGNGAAWCLSTPTTDRDCDEQTPPTEPVQENDTTSPTTVDVSAPQVYKTQYLESKGPILSAKVRMINPAVAQGYSSCDDLKDDILNALKHFANSIIVSESQYSDWYENCDPNATNNYYPYIGQDDVMYTIEASTPESAPLAEGSGASGSQAAEKVQEDSYETNNQVDGVDEADIVKSDGDYVYAAYGDQLFVWSATDGTKGVSITKMPHEEIDVPEPDEDVVIIEETEESLTLEIEFDGKKKRRNRHRKTSSFIGWFPCDTNPKPRILSLLLQGSRLTAIVSEDTPFGCYSEKTKEEKESILRDYSKITIKVYDITDVPTDGSPLKLVGEREIKGNYKSARSVGNTGFVITTTNVDTHLFANDLYRSRPQYCGLNSTEYEKLAAETAINKTESFMNQMLDELSLQLDGTCDSIFQVAAMQSGDSTEDTLGGDMLGSFVQVLSFNMSSDFVNETISTNLAGGFSSGWLDSVYASQEFVSTQSLGSNYNKATGEWDQSTFILGFDISSATPKPFSFLEVRGRPLNEYSVDLYDGHLRVVTTEWQWSKSAISTTNKLHIFKVPTADDGPEMRLAGETDHIGKPNEEVKAVRFIGDRAYIVTFETTDPFYIFNLTDPSDPKKLGELEIPGFSSYLHPVVIDEVSLMLGVGQHANETTGITDGVKISLFDISNPQSPTETATFVDKGAYSSAGNDYKAFRYLPLSKKLILPKREYTGSEEGNFDGFVVYDINVDDITPSYEIQHASSYNIYRGCWYGASMPARSFVFQSKLTTILSHSVKSTDLETGENLWNFTLDEGLNNTACSPYFF